MCGAFLVNNLCIFCKTFVLHLSYIFVTMKQTICVRFDKNLYDKINTHELQNSVLVRKAVVQFFRSKEHHRPLNVNGSDPVVVEVLREQIEFLKGQVTYLQRQNAYLQRGFFGRVAGLLKSKNE